MFEFENNDMKFKLKSDFTPTGDQPDAIKQLTFDLNAGIQHSVLHGATGTGKTFTIANVIQNVQKPTLIISHNKTLAAQLYSEFKHFFPENLIEYYISDFDYYQPEAYLPTSGRYIEKDSMKNEEISRMRLSAISALKSNRNDVIVVASVSCIFGAGNPEILDKATIYINIDDKIPMYDFLRQLTNIQYHRESTEFKHSTFRVLGDQIDIYSPFKEEIYRIIFWGDEVESLSVIDPKTYETIEDLKTLKIFPADMHVLMQKDSKDIITNIQNDLKLQIDFFNSSGKEEEAKRIKSRTEYDMEMLKEIGYCSGIENYSRYLDGRLPGVAPYCLLDYFPLDYLLIVDESHVMTPQIKAMYKANRSMKSNLVEYGFRLPAALDNRPLTFQEFEEKINQAIFVSATPAKYELERTEGVVIEQIIRPTGLVDPDVIVRPSKNQIDDFITEIHNNIQIGGRTLATTISKRMAEELSAYLVKMNIKSCYLHSEIKSLDRITILEQLKSGEFDVLVGVNLLREGLDLPEVTFIAIFDADKEGFLRNKTSMIQTIGRAARNANGKVVMYADKMTDSMKLTIDETDRRRALQQQYNIDNNITPTTVKHNIETNIKLKHAKQLNVDTIPFNIELSKKDLKSLIAQTKKQMEEAADKLNFTSAASLRDQMFTLQKRLK